MIQRIQTVYLALAAFFLLVSVFVPWVTYTVDGEVARQFDLLVFSTGDKLVGQPVFVAVLATLLLFVLAILGYKNRSKQIRFTRFCMAASSAIIGAFASMHYSTIEYHSAQGELTMQYSFITIAPLIAIVLAFMAGLAIKKDDDKVKSVDRLR